MEYGLHVCDTVYYSSDGNVGICVRVLDDGGGLCCCLGRHNVEEWYGMVATSFFFI